MSWTIVNDESTLKEALFLTRGTYQRALLLGLESLSGSTLSGKAKYWGGRYAQSRRNLLDRMTKAGLKWGECRAEKGKRLLVLG